MRFEYLELEDKTLFKAIPENDNEINGNRAQGPYVPIKLINNVLEVHYVSKNKLHPDIIAAICITCFYPWIKYSATMPFAVSQNFANSLSLDILPQFEMIDNSYRPTKPIIIKNIDEKLNPYSGGSNTVISYGGGADSTSIVLMFPDFPLIHSIDTKDTEKDKVGSFVKENLDNPFYGIENNCKRICRPGGFTTYTNIFIAPLIMSADLSISNVMCGSVLGSSCLHNGKKFKQVFNINTRNRWELFYKSIGLDIFSPISGCSELITSKINYVHNLHKKVLFCELENGEHCFKCTKCLRKQLQFNYHGDSSITFDGFDEEKMKTFLKQRPFIFVIFS